jgi:hypothetical protein
MEKFNTEELKKQQIELLEIINGSSNKISNNDKERLLKSLNKEMKSLQELEDFYNSQEKK